MRDKKEKQNINWSFKSYSTRYQLKGNMLNVECFIILHSILLLVPGDSTVAPFYKRENWDLEVNLARDPASTRQSWNTSSNFPDSGTWVPEQTTLLMWHEGHRRIQFLSKRPLNPVCLDRTYGKAFLHQNLTTQKYVNKIYRKNSIYSKHLFHKVGFQDYVCLLCKTTLQNNNQNTL